VISTFCPDLEPEPDSHLATQKLKWMSGTSLVIHYTDVANAANNDDSNGYDVIANSTMCRVPKTEYRTLTQKIAFSRTHYTQLTDLPVIETSPPAIVPNNNIPTK